MRLLISGPVSGVANQNRELFAAVEAALHELGYLETWNPTAEVPPTASYREAMRRCLEWLCAQAEGVVSLPGAAESPGARAEAATAQALGLPMWTAVGFGTGQGIFLPASFAGNQARRPLQAVDGDCIVD